MKYKKSFSLLELIILIVIIAIISSKIDFKYARNNLNDAVKTLKLHLNYTRYIAHIDNKKDIADDEWSKKLWTLKFQRCSSDIGGVYYVIYSDRSGGTAHFKKKDTLKEPLTNKYLYSNSDCIVSKDESDDVLLTKKFGINDVEISCNTTSSIGQISFGFEGKIFSSLGENIKEIKNKCTIKLIDDKGESVSLTVEPETGYIY